MGAPLPIAKLSEGGIRFNDKYFALACTSALVEGFSVVAPAFVLREMAQIITSADEARSPAQLYLLLTGCVGLRFLSSAAFSYFSEAWRVKCVSKFLASSVESVRGRVDCFSDTALRDRRVAGLVSPAGEIVTSCTQYALRLFRAIAIAITMTWAVGLLINPIVVPSLIAGSVLGYFVAKAGQKYQALASTKHENRRILLAKVIANYWDNIVLNNAGSSRLWKRDFLRATNKRERDQHAISSLAIRYQLAIALSLHGPTLLIVGQEFLANEADFNTRLTLIVSFPFLLLLLGTLTEIISMFGSLSMFYSQLAVSQSFQSPPPRGSLNERIRFEGLTAYSSKGVFKVRSLTEFLLALPVSGRVTVRGPNGVGKSSLLLMLKDRFKTRAFILPASSTLAPRSMAMGSTGERLLTRVLQILSSGEIDILLLDEWNANLDESNAAKVSQAIDVFANSGGLVIECVHREYAGGGGGNTSSSPSDSLSNDHFFER